jgi:large-conductance mechanosensitive channel
MAQAEPQQTPTGASLLENIIWGILPFILIGVFIWFFFLRTVRKSQVRSNEYMERMKQHNERVEHLLERIAVAVEERGKDPS